jgi:hypothetical protein
VGGRHWLVYVQVQVQDNHLINVSSLLRVSRKTIGYG